MYLSSYSTGGPVDVHGVFSETKSTTWLALLYGVITGKVRQCCSHDCLACRDKNLVGRDRHSVKSCLERHRDLTSNLWTFLCSSFPSWSSSPFISGLCTFVKMHASKTGKS
jgi:hypothetical protein